MNTLRQRKHIVKTIQEFDAFPKVDEDHQETSAAGGGLSLAVFALIALLVVSEIYYYVEGGIQYKYDIDPDFDKKLKLNIDMMVAMKCSHVGADILDLTGENADTFGTLEEEPVNFDLASNQLEQFYTLRGFNTYLRQEYHALHETLWKRSSSYGNNSLESLSIGSKQKSHQISSLSDMFPLVIGHMSNDPNEKSGCRFRGTLEVNKVAGNFHITAGKSVPVFPKGHAHLSFMMKESDYNFSHRILHFSFGDKNIAIVNPLDGEEKIIHESSHIFQYFVQVVPTVIETTFSTQETYQYAATEQNRTISHSKGSHGLPGIFMKYDLSPLRVTVMERSTSLVQLFIRLCSIIGGIFATSGFLHQIITGLFNTVCCQLPKKFPAPSHHHHDNIKDAMATQRGVSLLTLVEPEKLENPNILLSLSENGLSEKVPFRDL